MSAGLVSRGITPDPAMGAILGGVLRGQCRVDGEGARKREVSSFGGHGSAAMRRPEANRDVVTEAVGGVRDEIRGLYTKVARQTCDERLL